MGDGFFEDDDLAPGQGTQNNSSDDFWGTGSGSGDSGDDFGWGDDNSTTASSNADDFGWGDSNDTQSGSNADDFGWGDEPSQEQPQQGSGGGPSPAQLAAMRNRKPQQPQEASQAQQAPDQMQQQQPVQVPKPPVNFSVKTACILVGVVLFVVFLLIMVLRGIDFSAKEPSQPQQGTTQQSSSVTAQEGMIKIPDTMVLDMSGEQYTALCQVGSKSRYLDGNQVVYCLDLVMNSGINETTIRYFCSFNVWSMVGVGDSLNVKYTVPQEGYFAVIEITR